MKIHFNTLENEKVLGSSDNEGMILTNQRIHNSTGSLFGGEYMTMNLEDISSIQVKHSSNFYFFVLAGIGAIYTLFTVMNKTNENTLVLSGGLTILFIILYFSSRKKLISICSTGASKMNIEANSMNSAAISDYLDKLAKAKSERMKELRQSSSIHID